jgi:hypothetical protein
MRYLWGWDRFDDLGGLKAARQRSDFEDFYRSWACYL